MMRSSSKIKFGAIAAILVAFFILVNLTGFSGNIRNFFYTISAPFQKSLWAAGAGVSGFFSPIFRAGELNLENERLHRENQELLQKTAELDNLKKENEALKEAFNMGLDKEFRLFLSQVIAKDLEKDVILIDKGAKDGLSPGFPVITEQKVLIGKISEVYDHFSRVTLITNSDFVFGVKTAGGILGEAKGEGRLNLVLDRIPGDREIKEGEAVVTTSLDNVFPDGILVGQIKDIKKSDTGAYQQARIKPSFDINGLDKIFLIINF